MKKKPLSILLMLCLVFSMLPGTTVKAATTYYYVWVGGVQVTSENMTNVLGDGTVSFTVDTVDPRTPVYTLTLSGANITGGYTSPGYKSGIYTDIKLNIVLADGTTNSVTAPPYNEYDNSVSCGIYTTGELSFSGGGSLTVTGGAAPTSCGIYAFYPYGKTNGITFFGTGTINARGGVGEVSSYGMWANSYIMVLSGTVIANTISTSDTAQAMNKMPVNLSNDYTITAGASASGAGTIDSATLSTNINTYKYLKLTPPPVTAPATNISKTTATLKGTVSANNDPTTVIFEYGITASYGYSVSAKENPVGGDGVPVSYSLTGLAPGTTYHYRVKAVNSAGTRYGSDVTFTTAPNVTAGKISISGGSGTGGTYKIGDTVTATWNNTVSGDNNSEINSVTIDFSQFGGGTAVAASNSGGNWTATYTIITGSIDATNRNVSVTVTNAGGTTTTAGTTNAVVDNIPPTITDGNISISGGSGAGGTFKPGDTVTATWNNTASGDNNADTIISVTVNFGAFDGSAAVTATNSSGIWTADYTITESSSSGTNKNVSVSVTDNAGNTATRADTTNATVNTAPDPVSNHNLTGKLTAPVKNAVPSTVFTEDDQYTGKVTWNGSPTKFLGGTAYTATVTLTAKKGYTFTGVDANSLSCSGAIVTHAAGSGNTLTVAIVFSATAARTLQSIAITTPPTKMIYQFGDTFNRTGMVVKATYDDGSEDMNFNAYELDKTIPLTMDDTTVTLTATANSSITATQSITVSRANGPDVPTTLLGVAPTTYGGTDGKITGTTALMEYADNTGFTGAKDCAETETTGLPAGTYYVRMKATTTHEAGAYRTVNVLAGVITIAVPTANTGLKWTGSEQTGVNSGTGYILSGTDKATAVGNYTATATLQSGYAWNDSTTSTKTISWSIARADGPDALIGLVGVAPTTYGGTDGKITGTTTLMEYADNTRFTGAKDCAESETTGLSAGNYYVRMKATTTHEAGEYLRYNVPAGVTKIAVPTANTGLKWTGSEQTGVNSGTGYILSGDYQATAVGSYVVTATLHPGYAWNDSTTTPKTISWSIARADGLDVPATLFGVAPTAYDGTDGKITGTSTLMEYADNIGFTGAKDCAETETTGLPAGTYYVRMKATITHEAGAYRTVNILAGVITIAVPTANTGLKWNNSEQTGVNSGTGYTLSGTDKATAVGNYTATATLQSGYAWNDSTTTPKSILWSIARADGPAVIGVSAVGCTTADNNDGKLIGVTIAMEYKKSSDEYYTTVTGSAITVSGSAITGLTSGDYMVRIAETDTHNAGAASTFTVASFIPAPTFTISGTITGSDTNSGITGAAVQLKSGSGNIGSAVFTDSSGAYTIAAVPAGTYTIEVSAAGYDSGTISSFDISSSDIIDRNMILNRTFTFIPVSDVTMTNAVTVQTGTILILTGTITPADATNRTITWSVENANGTGAIITGNSFRATSAGIATVKATVINGLSSSSDYNETFTITITAAPAPIPNPDPGPSPDPAPSSTEKPEGTVEKDQQQEDGAPVMNVNNSSDELKTSVLTPEEQKLVAAGENAKIILKVKDISASVSEDQKKLIQDKLAAENKAAENGASDLPVLYVDLSLYKQIGSREQTRVTETNGKIRISLEVPESFWNTDITISRAFYVVRIHDGEVIRIDGSYDPVTHLFTFETDRFSTYALSYQDTTELQTYYDFGHLQLKAKADKTTQTLSYKRFASVDGYLIYGGECGEKMTVLADVPTNTTSYSIKDLKQGTFYKYQVVAYRLINGEKVVIMTSKVVHTITESKTYANPTRVTSDTASVKLVVGKSQTVTCQVVLTKSKKLKVHTAVIRYESSNKAVATVNSKGKITAKAKGTCYVYAYTQNGVCRKIKVTVE